MRHPKHSKRMLRLMKDRSFSPNRDRRNHDRHHHTARARSRRCEPRHGDARARARRPFDLPTYVPLAYACIWPSIVAALALLTALVLVS